MLWPRGNTDVARVMAEWWGQRWATGVGGQRLLRVLVIKKRDWEGEERKEVEEEEKDSLG